ncbi:MAG: caspase family protein [Bradyrhizobium sp.]|nr:caspase family protein [Bradyrhizobium sp.]
MKFWQISISRRSLTIAAVLVATVSLGLGAHAALNKRALDAARAIAFAPGEAGVAEGSAKGAAKGSKIALVIGNGHYPDANAPLAQPINDARALTAKLRSSGFDVDVVEDASKDDMHRAVARLQARVKPDSVVMLFFGGYGVQARRESYMIPVDAKIWKEADVRREGVSIESVLDAVSEKGARAKLVVVDASRRNPWERRFRAYSHGLAPIAAPDNALILTSASPGKVADDSKGAHSVLMTELLKELKPQLAGIEAAFNRTRIAISRATDGEQVPSVSSSLPEDVSFAAVGDKAGS